MAMEESGIGIVDQLAVELVECAPDPADIAMTTVRQAPPASSPVAQAQKATLAHTGADPPPQRAA